MTEPDLTVVLAWHVHQPMFVPDSELRNQCEESYRNIIRVHRETGVPCSFNVTGALLERLNELDPSLVDSLRSGIEEGVIEPLASGYNHPLIPLLPYESARRHVKRDIAVKRRILETSVTGFWPTDLGWVHWMVPLLSEFNIEWTVIDSGSLLEANALPSWEAVTESGLSVLEPRVDAITAPRELHATYRTRFGDDSIGVLVRDHERSLELFGGLRESTAEAHLGALQDSQALDEFVNSLLKTNGDVVVLGEDGERLNTQTIRLYRRLLDRLADEEAIEVRTGTKTLAESGPEATTFFPSSTFQYDLRAWTATMDDRAYLMFLDRVQRQVEALERHIGSDNDTAAHHLKQARDALLTAEDSGVLFWRYAERTRQSGYEAAVSAYKHAKEGFNAL